MAQRERPTIGIITGSGPEAGLDLWGKVLSRNQAALKEKFRGDLDAPRTVILSEPLLGLSMELERNAEIVWASLRQTVAAMAVQADTFAIACNTLNWFAPQIKAMNLPAEFVGFQSVVADWLQQSGTKKIGILGAAAVTEMGEWSAYRDLVRHAAVEVPANAPALHELIYDVKRLGSADPTLRPRLLELIDAMDADTVLLACTELPLIADIDTDKTLVDVTDLVAEALVRRSLASQELPSGQQAA